MKLVFLDYSTKSVDVDLFYNILLDDTHLTGEDDQQDNGKGSCIKLYQVNAYVYAEIEKIFCRNY